MAFINHTLANFLLYHTIYLHQVESFVMLHQELPECKLIYLSLKQLLNQTVKLCVAHR